MNLRVSLLVGSVVFGSWSGIAAEAADTASGAKLPTLQVIRTIPLPDSPPDNYYDYAAVDPGIGKLFIGTEDGVTAVDLEKATARFVKVPMVHAVLPLPDHRAVSTSGTTDTAILFDSMTGSVIFTVKTRRHPDGATFDKVNGLVLVTNI
jgi:hypothetical protein